MAETERSGSRLPSAPIPIGIYSETHPLRAAALWGPVGAEAVLAQAYPTTKSLFYDRMNVEIAREEGEAFALLLEKNFGVQVVSVRNFLAESAGKSFDNGLSRQSLRTSLQERLVGIYEGYNDQDPMSKRAPLQDLTDQLDVVLELDHALYGEPNSVALNKMLCLDPAMPLGNLMFARDQMNVLLGTRIVSSMAKPIRQPEVALYEQFYAQVLGDQPKIKIPPGEKFEGGDAYVHNGYVYVGVGDRTTMGGALAIYNGLKTDLEKSDLRFAIVEDSSPSSRTFAQNMDYMHLDTFSNPIGDKEIAVCEAEAQHRRIRLVTTFNNGVILSDSNKTFFRHLEETEDDIVTISTDEQQEFGCNFLTADEDRIVAPLKSNRYINSALRKRNKAVIIAALDESTRGYGAAHCMTGQLRRSL